MMKYVNNIFEEHQSEKDNEKVLSVFDKLADFDSDENKRTLTQKNTQLAYEEIFEDWDVDLTSR